MQTDTKLNAFTSHRVLLHSIKSTKWARELLLLKEKPKKKKTPDGFQFSSPNYSRNLLRRKELCLHKPEENHSSSVSCLHRRQQPAVVARARKLLLWMVSSTTFSSQCILSAFAFRSLKHYKACQLYLNFSFLETH